MPITARCALEKWLDTHAIGRQRGFLGYGGPIATMWASSLIQCGPTPVPTWGLVTSLGRHDSSRLQGFVGRHKYFLRTMTDVRTGRIAATAYEGSFTGTGMVHQAMAASAAFKLCHMSEDDAVLEELAWSLFRCAVAWPTRSASSGVHNQYMRVVEAASEAPTSARRNSHLPSHWLRRRSKWLRNAAVQVGNDGAILLRQSHTDPRLFAPYNADILASAVRGQSLIESSIDKEWLVSLGKGLRLAIEEVRRTTGRPLVPTEICRAGKAFAIRPPFWIARSASAARAFMYLDDLDATHDWSSLANEIAQEVWSWQAPSGGIQNSLQFRGPTHPLLRPCWQDAVCSPRWNADVLALPSSGEHQAPAPGVSVVPLSDGAKLIETDTFIRHESPRGRSRIQYEKGTRWGASAPPTQWNQGASWPIRSQ